MQRTQTHRVHLVSSYDPKTHATKGTYQPSGQETGFHPIGTGMAANGYGFSLGPTIGDQFVIGFVDGDRNVPYVAGRLFSDKDLPPQVKTGEAIMKSQAKAQVFMNQAGDITVTLDNGNTFQMLASGAINMTGKGTVTIKGPKIVLDGECHIGGTGGVPAAIQGTVDTAGNADISNLATKVFMT